MHGQKRNEIINKAISEFKGKSELSILTIEDIKKLEKDINNQLKMAEDAINSKTNGDEETRYYILKYGDEVIAFQQAQIFENAKENGRMEGWRNLAYIEPEYAGKGGEVIDSNGILQNGYYSNVLYENISSWFNKEGVNYERTCTGQNMLPNIRSYVVLKGFIPFDIDNGHIYLEKILRCFT